MRILWLTRRLSHHLSFTNSRTLSTVFALSSGHGKCGVGVVRVTGSRASDTLTRMTRPPTISEPRKAILRRIVHPHTGEGLDRGLVLWFPGPHSFTGEDCCELQVHGGTAVIAAVLSALSSLPGYTPAQPGDFTRRAFHNNKLDLTAVEGLGDLIHAETEAQRKQALRQMEGALGELYSGWRRSLLHCRATLEAYIDFSEDDNIEAGVVGEVEERVRVLVGEIERHLSDGRRGERLRSGLHLTILGRPNVGKSSFLNTLVQRPAAIVSPVPGTTRDVVETTVDLGGYPVVVSDTAGLRDTTDPVEQEGVTRALARAHQADVAVVMLEATEILKAASTEHFNWHTYLIRHLTELGVIEDAIECNSNRLNTLNGNGERNASNYNMHKGSGYNEGNGIGKNDHSNRPEWIDSKSYVVVVNKADLVTRKVDKEFLASVLGESSLLTSVKTLDGMDSCFDKIKNICAELCNVGMAENPTLTAARHRTHITACLGHLKQILYPNIETLPSENAHNALNSTTAYRNSGNMSSLSSEGDCDVLEENVKSLLGCEETILVAAHHLQRAATSLGHVTGHITNEDVLNHIFSAFCIGK